MRDCVTHSVSRKKASTLTKVPARQRWLIRFYDAACPCQLKIHLFQALFCSRGETSELMIKQTYRLVAYGLRSQNLYADQKPTGKSLRILIKKHYLDACLMSTPYIIDTIRFLILEILYFLTRQRAFLISERLTGLFRHSSIPERINFSLSPFMAWAVIAMIGMLCF